MSFADMSWRFLRIAANVELRRNVELTVLGQEFIPTRGPVIIASRHYHHLLDGAVLIGKSARPTHIMVSQDWMQGSVQKSIMVKLNRAARWPGIIRHAANVQNPGTSSVTRRGLHDALNILLEQRVLVIFPEGYPNIDPHSTLKVEDDFLPFQVGIVRVARMAARNANRSVPIVPCGFHYESVGGSKWNIRASFGEQIVVAAKGDDEALLGRIETAVHKLSDPTSPSGD